MTGLRQAAARIAFLAFLSCAAAPAFAQRIGQGTGAEVPVWRVLGALILCLGLAVGAAWVLRRRLGGSAPLATGRSQRLKLVESLRLGHQIHICLVTCDGGEFLVASSPQGATLISPGLPPALPGSAAEPVQ